MFTLLSDTGSANPTAAQSWYPGSTTLVNVGLTAESVSSLLQMTNRLTANSSALALAQSAAG